MATHSNWIQTCSTAASAACTESTGGAGDDNSVHAIVTNNKVETIFDLKTSSDLDRALAAVQLALYRACSVPPEWFIRYGQIYRNAKEGIIVYAFDY